MPVGLKGCQKPLDLDIPPEHQFGGGVTVETYFSKNGVSELADFVTIACFSYPFRMSIGILEGTDLKIPEFECLFG